MDLGRADLRPARVLQVVDRTGTVKVAAPGIFTDQDDPELLPPVYPLFSISSNTFSTPCEGDPVWLLSFRDNMQELFYFRMVDPKSYTKNLGTINSDSEIECLVRRETEGGWGELYFDTGEGWVVANGDCKAVIDNGGNVNLIGSSIKLGSADAKDPVCKFNELDDAFDALECILEGIGEGLTSVAPQVSGIISSQLPAMMSYFNKAKSEKVFVDR